MVVEEYAYHISTSTWLPSESTTLWRCMAARPPGVKTDERTNAKEEEVPAVSKRGVWWKEVEPPTVAN